MQQYKHSPEVRAYLRERQRIYRAKQKAREAESQEEPASLTRKPPTKGDSHNGSKAENT